MGWAIILSILALPFAEIAVFIWVGGELGILTTLAAIILAGVIGIVILRWQGIAVLMDSRAMMGRGQVPAQQFFEAMLLALAGLLLLLPGFLSDIAGFLLLVPAVRRGVFRAISRNMVIVTDYKPREPAGRGTRPTIELDDDQYRNQ